MKRVGVLVAGGQALLRAGYRVLIEVDARMEVIGEAETAEEAVALAGLTEPDVALLDLGLAGLEHCDGIMRLVSHPFLVEVAVVVMTPSATDERVSAALRAGAVGVLARDAQPAELRRAVRMLAAGHAVLPVAAIDRLIDELRACVREQASSAERLRELTDREREVVALVGRGLTNDEIASHLAMSPATAKTHVYRAMTKLRARHRAELAALAYETGLVVPTRSGDPARPLLAVTPERSARAE